MFILQTNNLNICDISQKCQVKSAQKSLSEDFALPVEFSDKIQIFSTLRPSLFVFLLSLMLCFPMWSFFCSMSVLMKISLANWFFGDGSFTSFHSKKAVSLSSRLHQIYRKTIVSAWPAPNQAKVSFNGLRKAW